MTLKEKIYNDLKGAMKSQDKLRTSTIRMVIADMKKSEIDKKRELEDGEVLVILSKLVKQGQDSAAQFKEGGREDLVEKEEKEIEIIKSYLPEPLTPEQVEEKAKKIKEELGLSSKSDFGKLMKEIMARFKGQIDGKLAKEIVTKLLS